MKLRHSDALLLAEKTATLSDHRFRVGAVITDRRGHLLSVGVNKYQTHPIAFKFSRGTKRTLCAELSALVSCKGDAYNIYVVRLKKDGTHGMAKPCSTCSAAIAHAGIKHIEWSTS